MQRRLTIQTALTVQPQRLMHNEREYLLAPCIMIVEGVLNGGYVPGEEIRACPWDGIPLVINHPLGADGQAISANSPDALAAYSVGRVFHTQYTDIAQNGHALTRAQAELWLDTAQATALGGEALQAMQMLETQNALEVSTAFYSNAETQRGSFYGVPYQEIHRNLRADHLALLPNSTGACSWRDGCGAPRLNAQACACHTQERTSMEHASWWTKFVSLLSLRTQPSGELALVVQQTDQDLRAAIYGALAREQGAEYTNCFIDAVDATEKSFTYQEGERLKRRKWRMEEGVLVLEPDVEDVQRETTYIPVPVTQEEEQPMSATEVIKRRVNVLIANQRSRWTEDDRHMLESQDEAFLIRLEQQPLELPTRPAETVQEAIATLPPHLHEPMAAMAQEYETRKSAAIAILVANKQNPFSTEELQAMTAQRLEQLVTMSGVVVTPKEPGVSYVGQGMPYQRPIPEDEMPPPPPNTLELVVERQRKMGLIQ